MDNTVQHSWFSEHRVGPHERLDSWKRGNEQGLFMLRKLYRSRRIARFTHAGEFRVHAEHVATPVAHRQAHDTHCALRGSSSLLRQYQSTAKIPTRVQPKNRHGAVTFCSQFLILERVGKHLNESEKDYV
jgi:hypothetical protein